MVLPLDMPDNYPWLPGSGRSQMGDLGELASRLGSPVTYDRRGSVYWYDDFENGLDGYFIAEVGTGAEVRITHRHVFRGYLSAYLKGGSDGNKRSSILKRIAPALVTTYGIEATIATEGNVGLYSIAFQYNTGATRYVGMLGMSVTNQKLYYLNTSFVLTEFTTESIEDNDPTLFSTAKLVIDLVNGRYHRALFNQHEYDLSAYSLYSVADTSQARIETSAEVISNTGVNGIIYVDNMIVTVGDP